MNTPTGATRRPPHRSLATPSAGSLPVRFGSGRPPTALPAHQMDGDAVRLQLAVLSMQRHLSLRERVVTVLRWAAVAAAYGGAFALVAMLPNGGA